MAATPPPALLETHFQLPGQIDRYIGKVRDVYRLKDLIILIASDRISAFDHILPKPIPFKGQVLNQLAAYFLDATRDQVPNWLIATPDPNVSIGKYCEPIRLEMVIRGYLTGHAWRLYKSGQRIICGITMPEGMRENDPFPNPIITPATKAEEGHDEDISREEILARGIVSVSVLDELEAKTRTLFDIGTTMARRQGLILVDTKYEFGTWRDEILVMDEIHTPDSSRYFLVEGYEERQGQGVAQQQLSKEFVREWLMAHGFQGLEDQVMPHMGQDFVQEISKRYIELFEKVTGKTFAPKLSEQPAQRIEKAILDWLQTH
jgi:phosphoribosylaminoimidazole-succinocarboxamide synthase